MIHRGRVLGLIPARGGSKGIPHKNIVPLGDRPLIAWTIQAAQASIHIDDVALSSDDDAIIEVARQHGCNVPFKRDASLSSDTAATLDVIFDALDRLPDYEWIVLLQPTSPLRTAADIDGCIAAMVAADAPAAVSVRSADDHPYLMFKIHSDGSLRHFSAPPVGASLRRQDLPPAWLLNGAIYVANVSWLRRQRSFLTPETIAYPMPLERSNDIDTPEDLARVRSIIQSAP
ncbi:acylneuraminate cytidylyltransferase family protein [Chromobacterium alticapitis]|uniref:Acylneuraminate cytidylyltransferase n=1 Tax=Chromobacterium alticapitis TaxID=2073169 RepID=A0A2S5DCJ9_9NEIS|nr:acylneuraminate cytidylyltransferase family protein [Chromobacterium alticapitis]POZ60789.1 acylneuraminate cytidylyltransferase [Chromobacterium alticapitis]